MQMIVALVFASVALLAPEYAFADERIAADLHVAPAHPAALCAQIISCGTKNGLRKEYPTPCAAKDDGATNVAPKSGPACN
jgi:hypothetical protein